MDEIKKILERLHECIECYNSPATSDDQIDCLFDMITIARELEFEAKKLIKASKKDI